MDRIFYRKGTICKGGFINEQVVGYNVFIQFSGGSLEDRVHISNKILLLLKDYSGDNVIYDLLYNPSHSGNLNSEKISLLFLLNSLSDGLRATVRILRGDFK